MFANMTPELQNRYFREFMYEMDQKNRMRTAHEDGIEEGRAETAKAMKAEGIAVSTISDARALR